VEHVVTKESRRSSGQVYLQIDFGASSGLVAHNKRGSEELLLLPLLESSSSSTWWWDQ